MRLAPLITGFLLLLFLAGISTLSYMKSSRQPLPVLGEAPAFALLDAEGKEFGSKDLAGKNWIINFFFTSCDGPCPLINARLARLAYAHSKEGDLQFVSVTIDPEHDTPEALKEYPKRFGGTLANWHLLRGTQDQISKLAAGLKTGTPPDPALHSTRVFLIDKDGKIRGSVNGLDPKGFKSLTEDLSRL